MSQEFRVVQCYKCKMYQVDQLKKVNKWTCKICNEKQSVIKIYGLGSGSDCRKLVQTMNLKKIAEDEIDECSFLQNVPDNYLQTHDCITDKNVHLVNSEQKKRRYEDDNDGNSHKKSLHESDVCHFDYQPLATGSHLFSKVNETVPDLTKDVLPNSKWLKYVTK